MSAYENRRGRIAVQLCDASGAPLRADNSPKPAYRTLQRLIHEEWTSRGVLYTDQNGVAELEGFRGRYSLRAGRSQGTVTLSAQATEQPWQVVLQSSDS